MDVYAGSRPLTFTTVSRLRLRPSSADDGSRVRCVAAHPAVDDDDVGRHAHLSDEAVLTVLCKPIPFPFYLRRSTQVNG